MYLELPATTRELYDREILGEDADPLVPDENGIVRVSAEEGEALAEKYDGVRIEEDEREDADAGADAEETRDTGDDAPDSDDTVGGPAADETGEATEVEISGDAETAEGEAEAARDPEAATDDEDAAE